MPLTDTRIRNAKPKPRPTSSATAAACICSLCRPGRATGGWTIGLAGKRRTLALGVYPEVPLAQARARREEARASLARDADPSSVKKATKRAARLASVNTFEAIAREWLENRGTSLSPGYRVRIQARLEADIFPQVGSRPIAAIEAPDLLEAFKRVERRGAIEMAKRLRQVCGQVFRYAIATGRAKHDPSADLRGALKSPGRPRGHKAMPLNDVPAFLSAVAAYDGDPRTCLALRLVVLTFVRTTELRAAQWSEIEGLDGGEPLWRIPAERMKMKHEHIVPLAPQAVAVLRKLRELPGSGGSPFLFPSPSRDGYMSNNTMLFALYRMGYHGRATVHGFRALASTALNEMGFRPDVIERQLAHQEQNAVRAAYNRAEYLNERRSMMKHWADHLDAHGWRECRPVQRF